MNSIPRNALLVFVLAALAVAGGGCLGQESAQQRRDPSPTAPAADTKTINIGYGVQMEIPISWRVSEQGDSGEIVYISDCPEGDEDYFCANEIFVTNAASGPQALLNFSEKTSDFIWYCPEGSFGGCSTKEAKLAQVEARKGYWTVSSVGMVENAAVAFLVDEKYIIVFGFGDAESLYQKYRTLVGQESPVIADNKVDSVIAPNLAQECNADLTSDKNTPLSEKYKYTGVMGAMFTAFDCGQNRAHEVYEYLDLNNLQDDLGVGIQYMPQRVEVYKTLEGMGFECEKSLNSEGTVLYEGWCEIGKGKALSFAELKAFYELKPELSYSYFLLAPDSALKNSIVFENKILKTDSVCRQQPVETEIGSTEYAIAKTYSSKLYKIGEVFTQYQCGNAPFNEQGALFGWGSKLKLVSAPSSELKEALERAGFTCDDQFQNHSECTAWTLIPSVPIEYLFPIENHLEEVRADDCFHCG